MGYPDYSSVKLYPTAHCRVVFFLRQKTARLACGFKIICRSCDGFKIIRRSCGGLEIISRSCKRFKAICRSRDGFVCCLTVTCYTGMFFCEAARECAFYEAAEVCIKTNLLFERKINRIFNIGTVFCVNIDAFKRISAYHNKRKAAVAVGICNKRLRRKAAVAERGGEYSVSE